MRTDWGKLKACAGAERPKGGIRNLFAPTSTTIRLILLAVWAAVVLFMALNHVPWRDEARGYALAVQGGDWIDMIRGVQGEGHPILWYVWLRGLHDLFGVKEVLTLGGVLIGLAYAALFAWKAPFRPLALGLILLSKFMILDFAVVARNYGMVVLVLFAIAAWWPRIRDTPWLGLLLLILCNTAVPAVYLAGGIYLYRLLELWRERETADLRLWLVLGLNGLLLGVGALACFLTVYPTANDAAAYATRTEPTFARVLRALFWNKRSFHDWGIHKYLTILPVILSLLIFRRHWPALVSAALVLILFRLQYFFIYPGYYRHSTLFLIFLVTLAWILFHEARIKGEEPEPRRGRLEWIGLLALTGIFASQVWSSVYPIRKTLVGTPYSPAAKVADLIERTPELKGATVMAEPDTWGESVAYQLERPVWLLRQKRLGTVSPLIMQGRKFLILDDLLEDAELINRRTGRKVVILLWFREKHWASRQTYDKAFGDYIALSPEATALFHARTRRIAQYRKSLTDEKYDVYVYPR